MWCKWEYLGIVIGNLGNNLKTQREHMGKETNPSPSSTNPHPNPKLFKTDPLGCMLSLLIDHVKIMVYKLIVTIFFAWANTATKQGE
jgi:hypothetical protein